MTQEYFCLPAPFAICEIGRKIRLNRRAIFRSMSDLCQVVRLIFGQICQRKNERIENASFLTIRVNDGLRGIYQYFDYIFGHIGFFYLSIYQLKRTN